jgi:hypothetical protein
MAAVNWQLFVTPLIESGDAAANAIQVQNAKHFHELLGNYSRWHFHHPGPFFFYMFGAGEALFYGLLHVVPAPLNGEYLAQIGFNVGCLFLAIYIFQVNVRKPLLPIFVVLTSTLFLYVLYSAVPYSAINPIWPPYVGVFSFLLLACLAASVASGNWKHLPLLTLVAMIMIHAHVAQLLFSTVLLVFALLTAGFREISRRRLKHVLKIYSRYFFGSCAIVVLFLLPIIVDWSFDHPNNIHQIRAYLRQHHGEHNPVSTTILYVFSFFSFYRTTEIPLASSNARLIDVLNPQMLTGVYWSVFTAIAIFALISYCGRFRDTPLFLRFVFIEAILIIILFAYWSYRITGPMYNFNGFFFFSIQLFLLWGLCALIAGLVRKPLPRRTQIALACASTAPLLLLAGVLNGYPTDGSVLPIVSQIRASNPRKVEIIMQPETWPTAAGVASYLERDGIDFCVEPDWEFTFGSAHTCTRSERLYRVSLTDRSSTCKAPCSVIYKTDKLYVTEVPPAGRIAGY